MRTKLLLLLAVGLIMAMGAGIAFAAPPSDDSETSIVSVTIPEIRIVNIAQAASSAVIDETNAETAFDDGYIDLATQPQLTLKTNDDWELNVKASAATFSGGSGSKAVADLMLLVSDGGHRTGFSSLTPLTTSDVEIATHTGGVSGELYNCTYRVMLDFAADTPGVYTMDVIYSIVAAA